jgi:hypothetical protein
MCEVLRVILMALHHIAATKLATHPALSNVVRRANAAMCSKVDMKLYPGYL